MLPHFAVSPTAQSSLQLQLTRGSISGSVACPQISMPALALASNPCVARCSSHLPAARLIDLLETLVEQVQLALVGLHGIEMASEARLQQQQVTEMSAARERKESAGFVEKTAVKGCSDKGGSGCGREEVTASTEQQRWRRRRRRWHTHTSKEVMNCDSDILFTMGVMIGFALYWRAVAIA